MLSLTGLIFALVKEVEAADQSSRSSLSDLLDDDTIRPKDLQLNGTIDLILRDGRHYTLDDPEQTIVVNRGGSIGVVANSGARMLELQTLQQEVLATYAVGYSGPTSTGGGGSSTPPSLLISPLGLQPINFIQDAPTAPNLIPANLPVIGAPASEPIAAKAQLPASLLLTQPGAVTDVDTAAFDTFKATSGSFVATDANGGALTYGIVGGTTGAVVVLGGAAYDVSAPSPYGTLYLNSSSGFYAFVPDSAAINTLTAVTTEQFIITASNGSVSTSQTLIVAFDGANDTPTFAPVPGITLTDTAQVDHFGAVIGTLHGTDVDLPAQTLTYGIVGGGADVSSSGYNQSVVDAYGKLYVNTVTGSYIFIPDDMAINALTTTKTESFTFTVSDGALSVTQAFAVTITGTNDAASISGTASGAVTEDDAAHHSASGQLAVADDDSGENHFATPGLLAGSYGTFTFNPATGQWGYTLDNSKVQFLGAGITTTDKLTVTSADHSASQDIVITITGTNDAASISGTASGA
ncbi:VCBS domain-containing protein, partial [Bradyrhizobium sp. MOS002]|uniref:VCBS domain-containing protein n=1 Tax=Bradyrhizobium sp. MOS002 TaxID=2133947 RepID=UPI000D4234DE